MALAVRCSGTKYVEVTSPGPKSSASARLIRVSTLSDTVCSKEIEPGVSMRNFVVDFLGKPLADYLHKHSETAQILQKKIVEKEKARKAI